MGMHIPVVKFLADFLESCSFICMFGLPHLHCFKKKKFVTIQYYISYRLPWRLRQ